MKLPQYNSIDDAVALLKKSKNIIVLTGAGVVVPLADLIKANRVKRYPPVLESLIFVPKTPDFILNSPISA